MALDLFFNSHARSTILPPTLCCDLSSCMHTTVPVGMWVILTALSVVLTCQLQLA
jgi:hypothetical protein